MDPAPVLSTPSPPKSRVLVTALLALFLLGSLGALYEMVSYAGPYRWFAELQLRFFDAYYTAPTVALTLAVCVVPFLVILRLLSANGTIPADSFLVALLVSGRHSHMAVRGSRARRWLTVFGVGLVVGVMSGRDMVVASRGEQLERVTVSALEQGAHPRSTWLEIEGKLDWDASLQTEEGHKTTTYVPIVSEAWKPGTKVGAVLRLDMDEDEWTDQALRGTVDLTGLPGVVRSAYEDAGLDADDAVLLTWGESPAEKAAGSRSLAVLAFILMSIGGLGSLLRMRR